MRGWKGTATVAVTLWLCAALQSSMVHRFAVFGAEPDFLLVAVACLSWFYERSGATVIGFFAGAIYGAVDFANMTQYVVSRSVAGFAAGWSKGMHLEGAGLVVAVTAVMTTVVAKLVLIFLAPPPVIMPYLGATIRTAVYNGVLAVPMYLCLKRIMGPSSR